MIDTLVVPVCEETLQLCAVSELVQVPGSFLALHASRNVSGSAHEAGSCRFTPDVSHFSTPAVCQSQLSSCC